MGSGSGERKPTGIVPREPPLLGDGQPFHHIQQCRRRCGQVAPAAILAQQPVSNMIEFETHRRLDCTSPQHDGVDENFADIPRKTRRLKQRTDGMKASRGEN